MKTHILKGALTSGDALPSIRVLARKLKVSVIITKRTYDELEKEGFINQIAGKGFFVAAANDELLRETKLRNVEECLAEAVDIARQFSIEKQTLFTMLDLLFPQEHDE